MKNIRKVSAIVIIVVLFCMLFFSFGYMGHNAKHECNDLDCNICIQLEQIQQFVTGFIIISKLVIGFVMFNMCASIYLHYYKPIILKNTLILLNVELLN